MRRMLTVAALAAFVSSSVAVAQTAARNDRLDLKTYLDLEGVEDPRLAPDGKAVVFGRRHIDKMNDRWESALWAVNPDGSRAHFLVKGSSARWSPDGSRIAYIADGEPRGAQIYVRYMDAEGSTTQVARLENSPSDIEWSPDGRLLAFRMNVTEKDDWRVEIPAAPKGAKWTEAPKVVSRLSYRRDRVGFTDGGFNQLFVVAADGGTPRQLTEGPYQQSGLSWTPNSRRIVFGSLRVPDAEYEWRESEIYAVEVATGVVAQLTSRKGPDGSAEVSPDGRMVAYTGMDWTDDTYRDSRLYLMNIDGSSPRMLTGDLDRSPIGMVWAADNSGIYFHYDDAGARNLHFVSVKGVISPVTKGNHMLTVSSIDRTGMAVGIRTSATEPGDVVAFSVRKPELRALTSVNADILEGRKLGDTEEIWYTSVDGLRVQGWLLKPPGFDPAKKYPLMLEIHGGPHAMYNPSFSYARQTHVAEDMLLLFTNPRGSTGYGSAFGNAIKNDYPGKDYDDLMAGVDLVIGKGIVDVNRMYVFGCSGGGVLTAWIVGHTDRFAAASANCPVINWLSFVGTTDGASWYNNFAKLPWEDPSEHLRRSPLMYVGNVSTPTMLMTGVNDLRTPIPETEQFYEALKLRKVPTAMIRFNDEWHGTSSKPSNFLRTQAYLQSWFGKWTKAKQAALVP